MAERHELESIARAWIALWDAPPDHQRFEALHAADFEDCSSAGRPTTRAAFFEALEKFASAFPDVRTAVTDLVVDLDQSKVAIRWRAEGTNREPYLGAGPTHRLTGITGIEIIELRSGQVVRRWGEWDISAHLKT